MATRYRLSHKKELYYISCIVAVLAILLFSLLGPGGYRDLQKARLELQERRVRVDALRQDNAERKKTIEALRFNKNALEKIARDRGYGRVGELSQRIPDEPEKKSNGGKKNSEK
jgi:cell division protein FtsB